MSDTIRNENDPIVDPREGHAPPEAVEGAHDADGTMGRVAGTGSGIISGAIVGTAVAGPIGTVVGAVAGAVLGAAAGNAAHHVGDDQDDVNVETGSGGDLGKNAGAGAGGLSGAIVGGAAGGPVGAVAGAVAGGMLGAAAGNAAKDVGGDPDNPNVVPANYDGTTTGTTSSGMGGAPLGSLGTTGAGIGTGMGSGMGSDVGGHNVVTGDEAKSDAGKAGLGTGAVVGGLIGTAVGGPVGAVVGGTIGSLVGGTAGDAAEATDEGRRGVGGTTGMGMAGTVDPNTVDITDQMLAGTAPTSQAGMAGGMGAVVPGTVDITDQMLAGTAPATPSAPVSTPAMGASYGTYEGRDVSRDEYERMPEGDRMRVQLVEESLDVSKMTRQSGEVEVSKHVVEEQVQVPVTLRHEEVVITRHAVDTPVSGAALGQTFQDETIRVPVHEEVAQVSKTAHVAEEIEIQKRAVTEQQTVSDTVRREVVDINQAATGTTTGTMGNAMPGVQTGGVNADGSPDTRGVTEKAADALTGDATDDKTGRRI